MPTFTDSIQLDLTGSPTIITWQKKVHEQVVVEENNRNQKSCGTRKIGDLLYASGCLIHRIF